MSPIITLPLQQLDFPFQWVLSLRVDTRVTMLVPSVGLTVGSKSSQHCTYQMVLYDLGSSP